MINSPKPVFDFPSSLVFLKPFRSLLLWKVIAIVAVTSHNIFEQGIPTRISALPVCRIPEVLSLSPPPGASQQQRREREMRRQQEREQRRREQEEKRRMEEMERRRKEDDERRRAEEEKRRSDREQVGR